MVSWISATHPALCVVLTILLVYPWSASCDWFAECPKECSCKWISGKKAALCVDLLLESIPRMSSDIQHLDLSNNSIQALGERAVAGAGVPHVQKLYLSRCKIRDIDKTAFAELGNMIELDLSFNQITNLQPATFKGLNRLRKLVLRGNPLGKLNQFQFPNLRNLVNVDLSECRLAYIDPQAFLYLKAVEVISLRGNRFERLRRDPFLPMKNLKSLELFDNPWRCDCLLKDLREWLLETKLYAAPTSCSQPDRLHGKPWDMIGDDGFACKPAITVAEDIVAGYRGDNVTLACKFTADPPASSKWVFDSRILTNMSQIPFGDQFYLITESDAEGGAYGVEKWLNLTITNINEQDAGDYKCIGVNPGGMDERNITLRFHAVEPAASPVRLFMPLPALLGMAAGLLVLIILVISMSVCLYRRRRKGSEAGTVAKTKQNGTLVVSHHSTGSSIVGISPMRPTTSIPSHHNGNGTIYEKVPTADMMETRIDEDCHKASFEDDDFMMLMHDSSGEEFYGTGRNDRGYNKRSHNESSSRSTRTPETASIHSDHPSSSGMYAPPANYPDLIDVHRKYSAPPTSSEWPMRSNVPLQMGYVTLPRRPRASWSHPNNPVPVPPSPAPSLPLPYSFQGSGVYNGVEMVTSPSRSMGIVVDPVYDNLGPRTSADGTLRRPSAGSTNSSGKGRHLQDRGSYNDQVGRQQPNNSNASFNGNPYADFDGSRRSFQYSTLPRSTPNVSESPYAQQLYHGRDGGGSYRLPPVREESLGAADARGRNLPRNRPSSSSRIPSDSVPRTAVTPLTNGMCEHEDSDGDMELPPPPESIMDLADEQKMMGGTSRKVPPKPPPKPNRFSQHQQSTRELSDNCSTNFQDEGDDGTEI